MRATTLLLLFNLILSSLSSFGGSLNIVPSPQSPPPAAAAAAAAGESCSSFSFLLSRRSIFASSAFSLVAITNKPTTVEATALVAVSENNNIAKKKNKKKKGVAELIIHSPDQRLGLEVYDVTIGASSTPVVAIRRVLAGNLQQQQQFGGDPSSLLQPGMVCREFPNVAALKQRLQEGPFPVQLQFENLAAGGDAIDDIGKPIVSAQDALQMAQEMGKEDGDVGGPQGGGKEEQQEYSITTLDRPQPQGCANIQSRRGDVLEIRYEAHMNDIDGIVYDGSDTRGTGQPYQMVLGSYDSLPGVDQGLYDMCIGDIRLINIPPPLAYGMRGNKLFRIPPNTTLVWKVELVSINSIRQGDTRTRDDVEGRVDYY